MFIDNILKYIEGSIRFNIIGMDCDRLIDYCIEKEIALWHIKSTNYGFEANAYIDDYKSIAQTARKLGMRSTLVSKKGLRFFIFRNRKRYGIIIGIIIFIGITSFLNSRVWNIEISGNQNIADEIILENLQKLGVEIGCTLKDKDAVDVERSMLINMNGVSFVGVNFRGTTVEVQILERDEPIQRIDSKRQPTNVIAEKSGQIVYMDVYDGISFFKKGDTVNKGDLIIGGIVDGKSGKTHLKSARGKVLAHVEDEITSKVNFNQTDYVITGKIDTIPYLKVGKYKFNLVPIKEKNMVYKLDTSERKIKFWGVEMPLSIGVDIYNYMQKSEIILSREDAKNLCLKLIEDEEKNKFRNSKIINRTAIGRVENNQIIINCTYLIETDIAKVVDIIIS